jgi:hypothetical protein
VNEAAEATGRRRAIALGTAFVIAVVVAALVRQPGHRTWDTVWAEDGAIYASDAYSHGPLSDLLRGYAGYAQLVPRIIALGVRALPVRDAAAYLAMSAALVSALLALFVERSMYGWVRSAWLRWLVAATSVLAPTVFFELNANIANLGWPLLFASFWAMASRRTGAIDVGLRATVVGLTALTTPVAAVLMPWAVAFAVVRRRRDDIVVLGTTVVALAVQWLAIRATSPGPSIGSTVRDLPTEYGVRVGASFVFGERWLGGLWLRLGGLLVVVAMLTIFATIALTLPWRIARERRWFTAGAIASSLATFAVPVWVRGTEQMRLVADEFSATGSRYVVVPLLMLLSAIVVLVDGSDLRRRLIPVLTIHGAALMIVCFGMVNLRSGGPGWDAAVQTAQRTCRQSPELASVGIPITPGGLSWVTTVPCSRLR